MSRYRVIYKTKKGRKVGTGSYESIAGIKADLKSIFGDVNIYRISVYDKSIYLHDYIIDRKITDGSEMKYQVYRVSEVMSWID